MSTIIINRIKNYLEKTFNDKIDLSDFSKKSEDEQKKCFLSRALAAYGLTIEAGTDTDEAGNSITDGYDDNGIDAIYFDKQSKKLWLVQSKFIGNGTGGVDNGDVEKFTKGVNLLIDGDFERFNKKIQDRQEDIVEALEDASVKIHIIFVYTGKELSKHNKDSINDLLKKQNDTEEIICFSDFNIDKIYKGIETGIGNNPINEDITIYNWGYIEEPYKSYYGQIYGTDLGLLWKKYGRRLFTENIRSFLGTSNVNDGIINTIKNEPDNFVYFNNGITILCNSINKKRIRGSDKAEGTFTCNGVAVVNGAQTLGSIGSLSEDNPEELSKIKVIVRFISLENSIEGFGQRITIANNTQNKVEKKDFVSLDSEQLRIKRELKLENIDYHYKRSDEKVIPNENNYFLEEVTFSLASLLKNVDYSTMIKKESGKLWEDVTKLPYTDLFNSTISAQKIIKAVRMYRHVTNIMNQKANDTYGREKSIYRYGNAFVSHIVFQKISQHIWADSYAQFEQFFNNEFPQITDEYIKKLHDIIEQEYSESMIVYVLRNYGKCRRIKELIMKSIS